MHPIEVAKGKHGLVPAGRTRIVWIMDGLHLQSDLESQAIICQLHAGRQARTRRCMRQVVTHVREVGTLGRKAIDNRERLTD
jgi:hypothetical protein